MSKKAGSAKPTRKAAGESPKRKAAARASSGGNGRKWLVRLTVLAMFMAALGTLAAVVVLSYYARDLPTVDKLKDYAPPQISRVLDRKGRVIAKSFSERRTVVPMERIPRVLVLSVLAAEDADFYRHRGLDYAGIVRAVVYDVIKGRAMQGASTITQQIVKNLLLTPERTIERKLRELILARRLEQELSKDEILYLYLNHINFGHGRYGVEEASRFYFGKHVQDLDLAEASLIAGIPQAPARLSPLTHPDAARRRQLYVLDQLERKRAEYWNDLAQTMIDAARQREVALRKPSADDEAAPEAAQIARDTLRELVGADAAKLGGYTVETTLDLDLQRAARKALRDGLIQVDERQKLRAPLLPHKSDPKPTRVKALVAGRAYDAVVRGADDAAGTLSLDVSGHPGIARVAEAARWNPKKLTASAFAKPGAHVRVSVESVEAGEPARVRMLLGPQGAVVVIDPRTRDVLALIGGDEATYGFDRASQAVRQPGSTWKPISYALAIDSRKLTPASIVLDAPEVYDEWKPNNYETWEYAGAVRLREALAQSINLVAVRVVSDLTPPKVVELARKLGITTELDPSLALALGASGVRPIELVNAYASFAAGGRFAPSRLIKRVRDAKGQDVKLPQAAAPVQAIDPASAYVLTSMLQSVVQSGTGKAAQSLKRPVAGKTGTSNRARDAWFVGYTPELVAGVWVGYDDLRPLGRGEAGGATALPIWIDVVKAAVEGKPAVAFPMPRGVVTAKIDPKTGKLAYEGQADAIDEVFVDGTAPTEIAAPPDVVDSSAFMLEQLGGSLPTPTPE